MNYIDVHAHLSDPKYGGDISAVINNMKVASVKRVINCGYDLSSSEQIAEMSEKYDNMYYCAGVHPDDAKTLSDEVLNRIKQLCRSEKCVAVGEIGFDFYWNKSTEEEQIKAFERQMELADELLLPFVVHSREASAKTQKFLKDRKSLINHGFLMHCYSESAESAKVYEDLGAYFSFGGVITFKNAKKGDIVKSIPIDRILSETDCPYLSPEPYRGSVNDPSRIPLIVAKIAEFKGITIEETVNEINKNAERLFYKLKCN